MKFSQRFYYKLKSILTEAYKLLNFRSLVVLKVITFFTIFLIKPVTYSQKIDSINIKKLYQFSYKNNDSLLHYSNLLINSSNDCYKYKALNYQAKAYYQLNQIEQADSLSNLVINNLKDENDVCLILEKLSAYNRLFWIYKNLRFYDKAFDVAIKRKALSEYLPEDAVYKAHIISVNHNLAVIKSIMGFYIEAREIFKENYVLLPTVYDKLIENDYYFDKKESSYFLTINQTSTLNLLGETYLNSSKNPTSKDLDSANYYFKQAFSIAQNFNPPHKNTETLFKLRQAEVLIAKKQYEQSLKLINKYSKNSKEYNTYQKINALKAINFHNLKETDSTFLYCKKFLINYHKEKNKKDKLIAIYDILSNEYYKAENIDSAFKYSELTIAELNLYNKNKSLVNKAHFLHNYNNIKKLNDDIIRDEKNRQLWFILSIIALAIVLLFFIFYLVKFRSSNKKEISKLIQLKETGLSSDKTNYNIDQKTEEKILKGIAQFENSKGFLDEKFTINLLAKKLNTNTTYLSFVFNKNYNTSFKQYITNLRIEYIIAELKQNATFRNYTIKALAEEIGYTNASAFTRAFKKYKGITPSEYIKSLS